jgi:hypothetical protein
MAMTKKVLVLNYFFLFTMLNLAAQKEIKNNAGGSLNYPVCKGDYISRKNMDRNTPNSIQQSYEVYVIAGEGIFGINLSPAVYPNSMTDLLTLNVKNVSSQKMSFILSDFQGKIIRKEKITENETTILMAALNKSTYHVKVLNDNKEIKIFKIVKNINAKVSASAKK